MGWPYYLALEESEAGELITKHERWDLMAATEDAGVGAEVIR